MSNNITPQMMTRVAVVLGFGATVEDIHKMLKAENLTEEEIFLCYCAGKVIFNANTK